MESTDGRSKDDWELELTKALARRLPGLYREMFRPTKQSLAYDCSLSIKPWRGSYLAVCRGTRVDGGGRVVCFGAGDSPLQALRNVSAALQKGAWKHDQYAKLSDLAPSLPATDAPKPLGVDGDWVGGDSQPPLDLAK